MSALARAILDDLTPGELAELAERLRPFLARPAEALLTPTQAAERLNLHPKTLTRAAAAGRVTGAERVGRGWRFRADELRLEPVARVAPVPAPLGRPRRTAASTAADAIRGSG